MKTILLALAAQDPSSSVVDFEAGLGLGIGSFDGAIMPGFAWHVGASLSLWQSWYVFGQIRGNSLDISGEKEDDYVAKDWVCALFGALNPKDCFTATTKIEFHDHVETMDYLGGIGTRGRVWERLSFEFGLAGGIEHYDASRTEVTRHLGITVSDSAWHAEGWTWVASLHLALCYRVASWLQIRSSFYSGVSAPLGYDREAQPEVTIGITGGFVASW